MKININEIKEINEIKDINEIKEIKDNKDIILHGKVNSGQGKGKIFIKIYSEKIKEHTGFIPFPGTLNIILDKPLEKPKNLYYISSFKENGKEFGKVELMKISINSLISFILFPERTTHPNNIIEIISPYELRKKLNLINGEEIEIKYKNL